MVDNFIGANLSPAVIMLINKFIFCSYIFIILQSCNIFPKNKKYPETYDEIFTMFSNDISKLNEINMATTQTHNFFLPVNEEQVYYYSHGREKIQPILDSRHDESAEEQGQTESSSHIVDTPLPPGWEEGKRADNVTYYHNQSTGMIQRERPKTKENILKTIEELKQHLTPKNKIELDQRLSEILSQEANITEEEIRQQLNEVIPILIEATGIDPELGGGSRSSRSTKKSSTKKNTIKKRIIKKPKKTIRNTK
jgi:hypothetical protein